MGRMLSRIQRRCPICQGEAGRHDGLLQALTMDMSQAGVPDPALSGPRTATDPEMAALLREANALRRRP